MSLVRRALATPPDSAGFEASGPSARERESFANVLRLRREEPSSPLLEQLQRKLDDLEAVRLTFLPEKFMVTTKGGTDMTAYRVEENLGDRLVLLEDGTGSEQARRKILSFDGNDKMVITTGATRVPMVRVAAGVVPRPNEVPSAPRAATGAGVPASGNAEYDACVKSYYTCIDRMSAADREAMAGVIGQTKKIFADAAHDPASMQSTLASCKQAVALGKSTFCP